MSLFRRYRLLLAIAMGAMATTATAQTPTADSSTARDIGTLLSVSAQAEVSRVPDLATLSAGVVTRAADANAAMRANAAQMDKVMATIQAAGIARRDIQTSRLNLNPQYSHRDSAQDEGSTPNITGYEASNTVNLKVRDIGKLGKVIDALVASGANQVNGPSFEVDKPEAAYDEARRAALDKAQARASMYAKSLGMRVLRIVSINEGGGFQPPRPMMARQRSEAYNTVVSAGETTLGANLDVVFELGK